MTLEEIEVEFDDFFEFDTDDRSYVTSTSAKLFAEHIVDKAVAAEREVCAKMCENLYTDLLSDKDIQELEPVAKSLSEEYILNLINEIDEVEDLNYWEREAIKRGIRLAEKEHGILK